MAARVFCLVCGCTELEVKTMHYFPSNLEKSKIWQESLGMKFCGDSLRNYRICSRHFAKRCYIGCKLRPNAVPDLFPCTKLTSLQEEYTVNAPSNHVGGDDDSVPEVPTAQDSSSVCIVLPGTI